ncbi:replication factor c subunit 3 [Phtheirospermum japonicum]|uniref:Replication factor c subunit 3 n=1 Tax=Phtheirospermum japonicum TaxID=374723 RepID=A0A830C136_9LAMI|nr:replication factor c subunit 3 [Phtheirospermum japonicum]
MAEVVSLMDIDGENENGLSPKPNNKGKNVIVSAAPPDSKATPWVEKYRPQSLDDVAAHRDIVETIGRLANGNRLPHLLLYGPPGTGKTSTVLALARKLYGNQLHNMVLELNASDDRGIDVIRPEKELQRAKKQILMYKLSIREALHQLDVLSSEGRINDSKVASDGSVHHKHIVCAKCIIREALPDNDIILCDGTCNRAFHQKCLDPPLSTENSENCDALICFAVIEKYTKSTRFALICNNVNKVIPALQSRCTRFRFAPLDPVHVTERLKHVISTEGLDVPEGGLKALVRLRISEMKTRKGLALLDIVREVTMFVFKIKMPTGVRIQLINEMADIEYRLTLACNDKLQLGSLIAAFTRARAALVAAAK